MILATLKMANKSEIRFRVKNEHSISISLWKEIYPDLVRVTLTNLTYLTGTRKVIHI